MDPYLRIEINKEFFKTATDKKAGKQPNWYDIFEVRIANEGKMKLTVMDEDTLKDDVVGSCELDFGLIANDPNKCFSDDVDLFYKGKSSGQLFMSIKYFPDPIHSYPSQGGQFCIVIHIEIDPQ